MHCDKQTPPSRGSTYFDMTLLIDAQMTGRNRHISTTTAFSRKLSKALGYVVLSLLTAGVVVFQGCDQLPSLPSMPTLQGPIPLPTQSLPASHATKFTECPQFFVGGKTPVVPAAPKLRELCYEAFAILHSGESRTPVFVAEKLNREAVLDADEKRSDKFFADARLPRAERAELSDYKGSGYSRGHMAPAGNMPTPAAMSQSFSLANMVPQNAKQNSGPWAKIEKDTRLYAARASGDVFVITGPVFDSTSTTMGSNQVRVPGHLYKLVYDAETGRAWAHWQPNTADARAGQPISYGELKRRIGMDLLPGLPLGQ